MTTTNTTTTNTPFWLNKPSVLFERTNLFKLLPSSDMNRNETLNAISKMVILLTILGYLITQNRKLLIIGVVTIVSIIVLQYAEKTTESKENFAGKYNNPIAELKDPQLFTQPKPQNPAMNVLLPEIKDNPKRKSAAPAYIPEIEKSINESTKEFVAKNFKDSNIDEKLFKDLGDNYEFDQSMRTWYATPNTQIPNDQGGFAEFCYGDMVSCKENNSHACTRSMPPRWSN